MGSSNGQQTEFNVIVVLYTNANANDNQQLVEDNYKNDVETGSS